LLAGCVEPRSHIFGGRLYERARDCVETTTTIDVVDGPDPTAPCDRSCLVVPGEAGPAVYVSTVCAPYPPQVDTSGTDPTCLRALAAYDRNDTCANDGGSSSPLVDGGAD
jgi:hypothetical protein